MSATYDRAKSAELIARIIRAHCGRIETHAIAAARRGLESLARNADAIGQEIVAELEAQRTQVLIRLMSIEDPAARLHAAQEAHAEARAAFAATEERLHHAMIAAFACTRSGDQVIEYLKTRAPQPVATVGAATVAPSASQVDDIAARLTAIETVISNLAARSAAITPAEVAADVYTNAQLDASHPTPDATPIKVGDRVRVRAAYGPGRREIGMVVNVGSTSHEPYHVRWQGGAAWYRADQLELVK